MAFVPTYDRARAKLAATLHALTADGTRRENLVRAWQHAGCHVEPENFPPELRRAWARISEAMTWREPVRDEGSIAASVAAMTEHELSSVVDAIIAVHAALGDVAPCADCIPLPLPSTN